MKKIYKLLYIFIITSVCGYVIELFWSLITKGILINHSAVVIGPFNFARKADKGIPPNNNYEIFLDNTFNSKYLKNMFNDNWG